MTTMTISRSAAVWALVSLVAFIPGSVQAFVPSNYISKPLGMAQKMARPLSTAPLFVTPEMSEEEKAEAMDKAMKSMTAFSNKYIANTDTKYCTDLSIPAVVIKGLAEHKVTLGAPLCPCRYYDDKEKEAKDGYWNCPCVPMRERHECHCMLFLTEDNDFAGEETVS
jgi:ferredoxin-thioredoxin reductase catalytic chain